MNLHCTDDQMKRMAALAVNASFPAGLGFLHFRQELHVTADDIPLRGDVIVIDYYEGRMVKFRARKVGDDTWNVPDRISGEYESWITTYDSYQHLFDAVTKESA